MFAQFYDAQPRKRGAVYLLTVFILFSFLFSAATVLARQPGGGGSTFTTRLINVEATAKETFRYSTSLHNGGTDTRRYELAAGIPDGWNVIFRADGSQIAGLELESDASRDISVEITATPTAAPGKYDIPVTATASTDTLRLDLEAVVKGNHGVEITTPTGRLSDHITEGKSKRIVLTIRNTGTLPLDDLEIAAQSPSQWTATFDPVAIQRLEPGQSQEVAATIGVPDKTIAGDYVTTFTVRNSHTNANTTFRMTVKTSLLSGWVGIVVILAALGMVYYLIRKYGRR